MLAIVATAPAMPPTSTAMRHTCSVSTTVKGVIIILVVGLVALAIAALADRRTRRLGEGADAPDTDQDPTYLTASQLQRVSVGRPPIDAATQTSLSGATELALHLASPDFATHDEHRSVAADTRVLVCDETVETVRETLPIWAMLPPTQAVTLVAPGFAPEVLEVLAANLASGTRPVQPIIGDAPLRAQIAGLTGATPQPRSELQAGGVPVTALGHAALIVASASETMVRVR